LGDENPFMFVVKQIADPRRMDHLKKERPNDKASKQKRLPISKRFNQRYNQRGSH
jgi:hypothetical protein